MALKVFLSDGQNGYARWIGEPINNIHNADVVMLTGGEDVCPSYYNQRQGSSTYANRNRDEMEIFVLNRAIELKKPIVGTCRGMQLLTVFMGGTLIQDIRHPGRHEITLYNGDRVVTNSLHHQLCNPLSIKKNKYELLSWACNLTPYMYNGKNENIINKPYGKILSEKEPESIYFPTIRAIGVQGHPEMMDPDHQYVRFLLTELERLWR